VEWEEVVVVDDNVVVVVGHGKRRELPQAQVLARLICFRGSDPPTSRTSDLASNLQPIKMMKITLSLSLNIDPMPITSDSRLGWSCLV